MTSSSRRAVLCADGRIHYGPEYLKGIDTEVAVGFADGHGHETAAGFTDCGPHYLAEQTVTTSPWVRVEEHNKGERS